MSTTTTEAPEDIRAYLLTREEKRHNGRKNAAYDIGIDKRLIYSEAISEDVFRFSSETYPNILAMHSTEHFDGEDDDAPPCPDTYKGTSHVLAQITYLIQSLQHVHETEEAHRERMREIKEMDVEQLRETKCEADKLDERVRRMDEMDPFDF